MAGNVRRQCAIYTRKSTEEGLDQAFNSLDAQRDACTAYVMSQCHEGWELLPELYDDGGYSGGTMERPGLQHLLADVAAGRVDVIVVYKVDRLTRSLADFAKIVEILDRNTASFVSVTQAFNTTTSMGRLTLNVLLSFAQFEREVTGERIRDKIAASRARGMWMGGVVPLGYEVQDRKLIVVPGDAERVRMIFSRYLALGSVAALAQDLLERGIRSRERVSRTGRRYGNVPFSRGALYLVLRNRLYRGEIMHRGTAYPGEHDAIVDADMFERAGALLRHNRNNHVNGVHAAEPSLLIGKLWDGLGRRMSPGHTTRRTRRYRYYASRIDGDGGKEKAWRVPAGDMEGLVLNQLSRRYGDHTTSTSERRAFIADKIDRVEVHPDRVDIRFCDGEEASVAAAIIRRGRETRLAVAPHPDQPARRDPALIKLLLKAQGARKAVEGSEGASIVEIATQQGYSRDYFGVLLRIAYLAPDIVTAILEGRQPVPLNRQRLARATNLPVDWQAQREMLGFG
ncbi:MAG: recombinase family protein [Sphingobium sp.]